MNNILEFLETTAKKMPAHIAVEEGQRSITWENLQQSSQKFGTAIAQVTCPGQPVAIIAEKSIETFCAMLGTVYAGCFYIIIDPAQPVERMKKIFETLSPALVLCGAKAENNLEILTTFSTVKTIKSLNEEKNIDKNLLDNIRQNATSQDLLYGIFTSGSTGTPKCIVVNHEAVGKFIKRFVQTIEISHEDKLGNQAPFDFDISVKDIYTSLFTGATLVLIPKSFFSTPALLLDYLCDKRVTVLIWAVSALTLVSALKGLEYKVPSTVRLVMFSGEVMPPKQLSRWQEALPKTRFYNLYGPTEITCNCAFHKINKKYSDDEKIPIGIAFEGREIFLLDEKDHIIKTPGVNGEICVSGESLAIGYYHNPVETQKRFPNSNQFEGITKRYYKTGDIGYYDEEGILYFSGRKDFQIKHMGHRIELEEIESAIYCNNGVERCCCLMDEKHYHLVAFYMGHESHEHIRQILKQKLPTYMVPHRLIQIDELPLNKNGKTDRKALQQKLERIRR